MVREIRSQAKALKVALRAFVAIIAVVAVIWLVRWANENPDVTFLSSFMAAQIPSAIVLFFLAYRTRFLSFKGVSVSVALRGNALAVAGSLFLPAKLGDLGKPFYFNVLCGFPVSKGLVLVVEERIWDFIALGAVTILALVVIGESENSAALLGASYLVLGLAVAGLLCLVFLPRLVTRLPVIAALEEKYQLFAGKSAGHLIWSFVISLLIWCSSLVILVVAHRFSGLPELELSQLMFLFVASTLGLVIGITPGSIGTYEGAIVSVLVGYGTNWDAALAFAIGFRLTWVALPLVCAAVALLNDAKLLATLRKGKRT